MRPKKTRWVGCKPYERCFRPRCKPLKELQGVVMSIDELEAIRPSLKQAQPKMKAGLLQHLISRSEALLLLKLQGTLEFDGFRNIASQLIKSIQ